MKKIILSVIIAAIFATAFTGCGNRNDRPNTTVSPTPGIENDVVIKPEDENGVVQDDNGIIGDKDTVQDGVLPEVGGEIEQGTNEIIDSVGDAVSGNDVSGNDASSGSRIRGRKIMN